MKQVSDTQSQTILSHMQAGNSISSFEAYDLYHITCLPQRIHELRRKGHAITGVMVTQNKRRFNRYSMPTAKGGK